MIDHLCNQKHLISPIVDFLWKEWSHDYRTLSNYHTKQDLLDFYYSLDDTFPTAYVMLDHQKQFISTCLIDRDDMGVGNKNAIFPGKSPWLANVFTHPEHRNKGAAKLLLEHVVPKYPTLYLWTFNQKLADYYKQFGFKEKQIIPKHGHLYNIFVMKYKIYAHM